MDCLAYDDFDCMKFGQTPLEPQAAQQGVAAWELMKALAPLLMDVADNMCL